MCVWGGSARTRLEQLVQYVKSGSRRASLMLCACVCVCALQYLHCPHTHYSSTAAHSSANLADFLAYKSFARSNFGSLFCLSPSRPLWRSWWQLTNKQTTTTMTVLENFFLLRSISIELLQQQQQQLHARTCTVLIG